MTDLAALRALVAKATPGPLVQSGRAMLLPSGDMLAMFNLAMNVDECHANVALAVAAVNALPALLDELASARRDAERGCWWARDGEDSDTWQTKCGHWFTVNEGTPSDNEMQYCPFCAGKIDDTDETDDAARGER